MSLMPNALPKIPKPDNFPFVSFAGGTPERIELEKELKEIRQRIDPGRHAPLWINGWIETGNCRKCVAPHHPARVLATYCAAREEDVQYAINTVLAAREEWSQIPWAVRFHIFRTAARLMGTKYLIPLVAAVMEDYSKNPFEAFIDVQELIDFLNFNVWYAYGIYQEQPDSNADTTNLLDYLPHEGFIFAVSPNNFIAINGNLCTAPLIMGNVVVAKPSSDVVFSFDMFLRILLEAGLPHDVLSVLYGDSKMIGDIVLDHPMLSGVHFTGGTDTFNAIQKRVGQNIERYRAYPKIVGETGGKNAIVVFDDADPKETATAIAVGAFGAQGRKCSATSRVYMTEHMFSRVEPYLREYVNGLLVGDVGDFHNYMGAIINQREYEKVKSFVDRARMQLGHAVAKVIKGQAPRDGWFIPPTVIVTRDPSYETAKVEIFGPVVTVVLLPEENFEERALELYDDSEYALTGAIQTKDVKKLCRALHRIRFAAGNSYDDRTTAAMVNQQPFSGGRKSGTNSKVGWKLNLYQWVNPRTIGLRATKSSLPLYLDK